MSLSSGRIRTAVGSASSSHGQAAALELFRQVECRWRYDRRILELEKTTKDFAILAPVPEEYLIDGELMCAKVGKVAYGSRAWEVFREVDRLRHGAPVDIWIYASHRPTGAAPILAASWRATYVGHVQAQGGAHPDGMLYRPPSTMKYPRDNNGYFAVFWEVASLIRLPTSERLKFSRLRGFGKKSHYGRIFVPEGPLIIECPV